MNGIIYMIECKINGKKYIGQTTNDIKTRWCGHLSRSKFNTETLLPCAIKELGEKNFTISQIDEGSSQHELDELERFYIEKYKTFGENGYNMTSGGDCGGKMSDIVKEKLRIKATGKHHTKETKEKLRQANLGKKQSPETIAKRIEKLKGQKVIDTSNMSKAQLGNKNFLGKHHSEETKEKLRIKAVGRSHSQKTIEKLKENSRKKWIITTPKGNNIITKNLIGFCLENNLSYVQMSRLKNRKNKQMHKGYACKLFNEGE